MRFLSLIGLSLAALVLPAVQAKTLWHQLGNYSFEQWMNEYHVTYSTNEEFHMRKNLFMSRLERIQSHNDKSSHSYRQGVNHLSDRTDQEFRALLGYKPSPASVSQQSRLLRSAPKPVAAVANLNVTAIDWREHGVVGQVKDQGQCGSCWAFGTTATIESHYAIQNGGALPVLSEQQILDCTANTDKCGGTGGCGGGTPELAYAQLITQGGQSSEWTYPYISYFGTNYFPNCSFTPSRTSVVAKVKGYVAVQSNDADAVTQALSTVGPLAINVDASVWHNYESGVFTQCDMSAPDINHVVQLVGWGTDPSSNNDYWTIKNSWSPSWGELGYIRILKSKVGANERCGVDSTPSDGTGCTGGPSTVKVCGECGITYDTSYPTF